MSGSAPFPNPAGLERRQVIVDGSRAEDGCRAMKRRYSEVDNGAAGRLQQEVQADVIKGQSLPGVIEDGASADDSRELHNNVQRILSGTTYEARKMRCLGRDRREAVESH